MRRRACSCDASCQVRPSANPDSDPGSQTLALTSTGLLALIVPLIAVTVRRLHDTDRSGWWYLLMLVPFVGLVVLVFMLLPGTPGHNRFGSPVPHV